jgi:hypothetical protein
MKPDKNGSTLVKTSWVLLLVVIIIFGGAATTMALSGKITAFTAEHVSTDPAGNVSRAGKLYVTPTKMRMEGMGGGRGQDMTMIYLRDKKKQLLLNNKKKLYFEQPLNEATIKKATAAVNENSTVKIIGTEKVNGYKCTKKEVVSITDFMGMKTKTKQIVWTSNRFEMPLRTKGERGEITEMRNIKPGTSPDRYFRVPSGYKRAANMMELMGITYGGENRPDAVSPTPKGPEGTSGEKRVLPFKLPKGVKLPEQLKKYYKE